MFCVVDIKGSTLKGDADLLHVLKFYDFENVLLLLLF